MSEHLIYFDMEDNLMDGNGWNVISKSDTLVAMRFPTEQSAYEWCELNGHTVRARDWYNACDWCGDLTDNGAGYYLEELGTEDRLCADCFSRATEKGNNNE